MSQRFPGGLISRSAPVVVGPTGSPPEGGSAPGIWTLEQAAGYIKQGLWPKPPLPRQLYSWGSNTNGRLGQGDVIARSSPVQVGALTDWSQVSGGGDFSAAVKTNGTLWTWGRNSFSQLGQNIATTIDRSSPVQVGALTDWSQATGGNNFCAAIKTNGTIWSWGRNDNGQLGLNDVVDRSSPVQVGALTDWSQATGGNNFCAAIKTNGTLWSWGLNSSGQLGQNIAIATNRSSPVQVGALTDWAQVSAGSNFCAAIKTNGTLWSWGVNGSGQLGQNNLTYLSSPVQVGSLTDWSQVSAGSFMCAAIKTNGTLWSWGAGNNGRLGLNDEANRSSPVQVGALTDWSQVSPGNQFCAAVKTNGTLWSWGRNNDGQLGLNIAVATDRSSPVQVGALTTWSSIGQGANRTHNLAIIKS
jgi:alpha-tubulin suppressor-like RCC1 family protein